MTTVIPFVPSNLATPSISMNLDGNDYNVTVTWNVAAQRYYINIYDVSDGSWVVTVPLVSSPPGRKVTSAVYNSLRNVVTVEMEDPIIMPVPLAIAEIAIPPGTMIDYTLLGFTPDIYNGKYRCLHIDKTTFTIPVTADPGPAVILGTVNRMLNMIEPLFTFSSLVFRNGSFEINP